MDSIAANLARVRESIASAAAAVGRNPDDVTLIAVSKTQSVEAINSASRAGQRIFGESTIQEALNKIPRLERSDLIWHFIGHLQSNKAKFIPGNFAWLHSVDSAKLAQRLSRLAQEQHATIDALIEINITRDPAKHGIAPEELFPLLDQLMKEPTPAVTLRGLMAIGPHPATETELRAAFAALRNLRDEAKQKFALADFTELSMGMSGDYVEAIKEGSTMVRVGGAIFGTRAYP